MDIRITVGLKIRDLRVSRKLSQEQLAYLSQLDRTYISSVENGKRNISIVNLQRIANALRVNVKDLLD